MPLTPVLVGLALLPLGGPGHPAATLVIPAADVVAWIDDAPVSVGELAYFLRRAGGPSLASLIADEGTTPEQQDKMVQALRAAFLAKTEQALMVEHGILPDASYAAFLAQLTEENAKRQRAKETGQRFFGPSRFTANTYYAHRRNVCRAELLRTLGRGPLRPDDDAKRAHYRDHADNHYREGPTIDYTLITFPVTADSLDQTRQLAEALRLQTVTAHKLPDALPSPGKRTDHHLEPENTRHLLTLHQHAASAILALTDGEASELRQRPGELYFVFCRHRIPGARLPFEQVRGAIHSHLIHERYQSLLDQRLAEATLRLNTTFFSLLGLDLEVLERALHSEAAPRLPAP